MQTSNCQRLKALPFQQFTGNPNDPLCANGYCHAPINQPSDLKFQFPNSFAAWSDKISPPYEPNPKCDLDPHSTTPSPCNDIFHPRAFQNFCNCKK